MEKCIDDPSNVEDEGAGDEDGRGTVDVSGGQEMSVRVVMMVAVE